MKRENTPSLKKLQVCSHLLYNREFFPQHAPPLPLPTAHLARTFPTVTHVAQKRHSFGTRLPIGFPRHPRQVFPRPRDRRSRHLRTRRNNLHAPSVGDRCPPPAPVPHRTLVHVPPTPRTLHRANPTPPATASRPASATSGAPSAEYAAQASHRSGSTRRTSASSRIPSVARAIRGCGPYWPGKGGDGYSFDHPALRARPRGVCRWAIARPCPAHPQARASSPCTSTTSRTRARVGMRTRGRA